VEVWPQECKKWTPDLKLTVAVGTPKQRQNAIAAKSHICVVNYDNLQTFSFGNFDGILFDELTRLKNPAGKRFKALFNSIEHIPIRWGMTGSFTSNGLEDVFGQCKIIDQRLLGKSKTPFLQRYFLCLNREYGEYMPYKESLGQVMTLIKPATYLLESTEYKDTLPEVRYIEMRTDMDDRAPYEKMKKDFVVELGTTQVTALSAATVTQKLQQMASGFVYSSTKVLSSSEGKWDVKQDAVWFSSHRFEMLDEVIQENQRANTIIVYNYKEEFAELKRRYPHALGVDDKDAIKKWNAGEVELLLLHPKSAGHGLNLQTGGHHMVFVSLPWSLELFEQTVGRLHRSGQRHDVWVYILLTNKTIDEKIWDALHNKKKLSDIALAELTA
jgi:SNF2 family DNA or RNA helicase